MTMVILAMLILISYQMKFKKLKVRVSIPAIVEIVKFHNPLKVMNATQLARKLNQDNEMRMKTRTSRLRGSEFLEFRLRKLNSCTQYGKVCNFVGIVENMKKRRPSIKRNKSRRI